MDFVCKLYGNTYAVHVTVALVGVATLNLALPPPLIFYREKLFSPGEKSEKNNFAPSEKFSCYAPAHTVCAGVGRIEVYTI